MMNNQQKFSYRFKVFSRAEFLLFYVVYKTAVWFFVFAEWYIVYRVFSLLISLNTSFYDQMVVTMNRIGFLNISNDARLFALLLFFCVSAFAFFFAFIHILYKKYRAYLSFSELGTGAYQFTLDGVVMTGVQFVSAMWFLPHTLQMNMRTNRKQRLSEYAMWFKFEAGGSTGYILLQDNSFFYQINGRDETPDIVQHEQYLQLFKQLEATGICHSPLSVKFAFRKKVLLLYRLGCFTFFICLVLAIMFGK